MTRKYRGRFAPSPTGPLHFGSLVAAVAGFLDARASGGEWLVRIEDVDTSRVVPGAADHILRTLEACGLHWDGPVVYQTTRTDLYREALQRLGSQGRVFACGCSRREAGSDGVYPGTCRNGLPEGRTARSWRFRAPNEAICFTDRLQGEYCENVAEVTGDFVLLRADGLFAYQLAVVVDDEAQGITDVVRGADLLSSTPRQIALQRTLGFCVPTYLHSPVAVDEAGAKLSKQTLARPVDCDNPVPVIQSVLGFLRQEVMETQSVEALLTNATRKWDVSRIPAAHALQAPGEFLR